MKPYLLLSLLIVMLAGCQKETISKQPIPRQSISANVTSSVIITYMDNNIKTDVIKGNVETSVLKNGMIIISTRDAVNPTLFHSSRDSSGHIIYYNSLVTVTSTVTHIHMSRPTGEEFFSTDVENTGRLSNMFADRQIQSQSCLGHAVSTCLHSSACVILCTGGGWYGCVQGWIWGCAFGIL